MRHVYGLAGGLALLLCVGALQGCDNTGGSDMEVHRTAEFEAAALKSRDGVMKYYASKNKTNKKQAKPRTQ